MKNQLMQFTALALLAGATGCAMRNAEMYRDDTQKLLETRSAQIKSCYDDALKADEKLGGKVTVHFVVEKETGKITNAAVVPTGTDAPKPLSDCVLKTLDGLVLAPPDTSAEGQATFVYEFKANPRQQAPAAPAPAAEPPKT
jgi:hypothetical protein